MWFTTRQSTKTMIIYWQLHWIQWIKLSICTFCGLKIESKHTQQLLRFWNASNLFIICDNRLWINMLLLLLWYGDVTFYLFTVKSHFSLFSLCSEEWLELKMYKSIINTFVKMSRGEQILQFRHKQYSQSLLSNVFNLENERPQYYFIT